MSYMAAQALLKTLILTDTSHFPTGSVSEGDFRILDGGFTNCAILLPGALPEYNTVDLSRENVYQGLIDLFTRFVDDTAYATFGTLRDSLIATIAAGPCLSSTYWLTSIVSDGDPQDVFDTQGSGPFFVMQRLRFTIEEQV